MAEAKQSRSSQAVFISILLILSLAFIIRIIALGGESIWLDEAHSVAVARLSPIEIWRAVAGDVHPPLYFVALHYWMLLAGDSEFSVRLLSVIFGCLSLLVMYRVGALLFDRPTGLLCALLLAVVRMHIEFSQEARMYSLLVLLTLLSVLFFLRLFERRDVWTLLLYVVCSILLMHTHFYALFVIAAQNLFFLLLLFIRRDIFRRTLRRWMLAQAVLLLLFVPWLMALIDQITRVREHFWIARFGSWILWQTMLEYAGTFNLAVILSALAGYAIIWHAVSQRSARRAATAEASRPNAAFTDGQKIIFLTIWFLTPVLLPFFYSQVSRPIYLPKYTLPGLMAFTILASRGIMTLLPRPIRVLPPVLIVTLALMWLPYYYATPRKANWREATRHLESSAEPGDLVVFTPGYGGLPFNYYSKRNDIIKKAFPEEGSELAASDISGSLARMTGGHSRVWLVRSLFDKDEMTDRLPQEFTGYELRQRSNTIGIELFLFEKKR